MGLGNKEQTIHNAVSVKKITSSTDATPIVITSNSHGLATNDEITVYGHTTNTNANGTWVITKVNDNSFSLNNSTATGGGAGGNTGVFAKKGKPILGREYRHNILTYYPDDSGLADMTMCLVCSNQGTEPNWGAPRTATNRYFFVAQRTIEDGRTMVEGQTGISGSLQMRQAYEANIDSATEWIYVLPTDSTIGAGTCTVHITPYTNL